MEKTESINKLTPKRDKFCRLIAEGKEQLEAYDLAGFSQKQSKRARTSNASKLMQNTDIVLTIEQYKKEFTKPLDLASQITVERQLKYAQKCVQECLKSGDWNSYLKAMDMQNKLLGIYAPTKTDNTTKIVQTPNLTNLSDQELEILKKINDNTN